MKRDGGEVRARKGRQPQETASLSSVDERAILVGVGQAGVEGGMGAHLEELHQLACTAGAVVLADLVQQRRRPHPGTYLGSGKLEELHELCLERKATLVITDDDLRPAQVRNMENVLDLRVIDRSEP